MTPDPSTLLERMGLRTPLIGLYDAPDPAPFAPLVQPAADRRDCVFAFYEQWLDGATLHLTRDNYGCGGCARTFWGIMTRSREEFIRFLVEDEGLKASPALMERWLDHRPTYRAEHAHILIGPLREASYRYLKTVTFWVNPDQLSLLALGAQYHSAPGDPPPVLAPFGSGCMQLLGLFDSLEIPQAVIGATDIAMRRYLPAEILAFTVTVPLYEQLCALDERSFLYKPFWQRLQQARGEGSP